MALKDYTKGADSRSFINIDDVLDVFHGVQESLQDEKEETIKEESTCNKKCGSCSSKCESEQKETPKERTWEEIMDGYSSGDGDDDKYICEYCNKIGYSEKYDPDICEDCSECEMCNEYGEECDGCTYSCHRDGTSYSDKLGLDELLSENDSELLKNAKEILKLGDDEMRGQDFTFCTLDL